MIIQALLLPIFNLIRLIINSIPGMPHIPNWFNSTLYYLNISLMFFPLDVWLVTISNIFFWIIAQFTWAIIEWIYKKIPGVS